MRKKHTITVFLLTVMLLISMTGCGSHTSDQTPTTVKQPKQSTAVVVTDSEGNTAKLTKKSRVISAYASFADCWLLSGGTLVGVTQDAINEHHLPVGDAAVIGTVKDVNLEKIAAQNPDYVILSEDLMAHKKIEASLKQMGIAYGYFTVDTFAEYQKMMKQFCAVNDREDLYQKNVSDVENRIKSIRAKIPKTEKQPSVLLMRAFSTGVKAKTDDNLAGQILKEFACKNIADQTPSLLEDMSVEQIIKEDPDYIFVLTMGDEKKAKEYLKNHLENNPAWAELSAVKHQRYIILPKDLFHYKPNDRWDESYEYLAKILYPEVF